MGRGGLKEVQKRKVGKRSILRGLETQINI
jgi:hypothetical protein